MQYITLAHFAKSRLYCNFTPKMVSFLNRVGHEQTVSYFTIHWFNKYLLRTYYAPGTFPGIENTQVNKKGKIPAFVELYF